jgi:hypothetical protein
VVVGFDDGGDFMCSAGRGVGSVWLGVLVCVGLWNAVPVSDLWCGEVGLGTYIELNCFIGRTLSFGKGSCCSVPSSSGSKGILVPANGRWPLLHFWVCSFSRLDGSESDRISRRSKGKVGFLIEVADMFSDSIKLVVCCSVEGMGEGDDCWGRGWSCR